jgi:hypothetical protein
MALAATLPSPAPSSQKKSSTSTASATKTVTTHAKTTFETCLECPICLSIVNVPLSTPCGHTFCTQCIRQHLHTSSNCPSCRKQLATTSLHPNYAIEAILDLIKRGEGGSSNPGSQPFKCLVCDEGAIRNPVNFLYAVVSHSGVIPPVFRHFEKNDGLNYCRIVFGGQVFETVRGQPKSKQAKADACTMACEYFFGREWSRTVFNKRGNGGRGVKLPINPHLSTLAPYLFTLDRDLHHDPVGAVNSICKSHGIPTPAYQPFPFPGPRCKVTCVISFMDKNFVGAVRATIRDAREDCARRILVHLLECGYQPKNRAVLESLESAFEALDIDETAKVELFAKYHTRVIPSN